MNFTHSRSQAGFTLIELMVALLLGVVLTSGVISVFITSRTSYSLNNAVGQVQEGGRFAMSTMQPVVSQAGYTGCANQTFSGTYANDLNNPTGGPVYEFGEPVYGFEFTGTGPGTTIKDTTGTPVLDGNASDWSPNLTSDVTTAIGGYVVKNSDILLVHEQLGNPAVVLSPYVNTTTKAIPAYASTTTAALSAGDIAIVSNCNDFTPFQISNSTVSPGASGIVNFANSGTPGNSGNFTAKYTNDSQVAAAQTYIFFVGKSSVDGGYSLFEASLTADTGSAAGNGLMKASSVREIVPGVENMQVLYGKMVQITSTQPAVYVPAGYETAAQVDSDQAAWIASGHTCPSYNCPWNEVIAVRIALVVRSDDNSIPKEQMPTAATSIQVMGVASGDSVNYYPFLDRRLHRYFIETISLRNSMR